MEIFGILLIVLVILLVGVTVVGHGIWMLLSLIFGQRKKSPADSSARTLAAGRRACPRCLTPLSEFGCQVCGWPHELERGLGEEAALAAVREQLDRYARLGVVDAETTETISATLTERSERVTASRLAAAETITAIELVPIPENESAPSMGASVLPDTESAEDDTLAKPVIPSKSPPEDRVRKYAASRAQAAAEIGARPPLRGGARGPARAPVEPAKRREAMSRLLAAFMEEKNIRWGELVGGLLIVGCSIALVISFWSEIAARPLLKFVLLNGVTAALFGVGLYTDRRWKIHTTSHGVLAIATLLVPLNFLAIAAFTQDQPPTDFLALAGEGASLLVFTLLVFFAGSVLVPDASTLFTAGVMIPSLMQLIVRRFAGPGLALTAMYALTGVPIAVYLASTLIVARRRWAKLGSVCATGSASAVSAASVDIGDRLPIETASANSLAKPVATEIVATRLLMLLGETSAAMVVPVALLAFLVPPLQETLHRLSPLVLVGGLPALVVGLLFWRRPADASGGWGRASASPQSDLTLGTRQDPEPSQPSVALQTAGIAAGVFGALIMAAAIVLAWPDPATLLPTALAGAIVFWVVAWGFGIPAAHVPAGLALAAAWLVGFHLVRGNVAWTLPDYVPMQRALISTMSGHALVPLVAVFGVAALLLERMRRREDGQMVFLLAAITAAASLALVVWFGFARAGDPHHATWTLVIYAAAALAAATRIDRPAMAWAGTALLLAALVQGLVYRYAGVLQLDRPWIVALLAHATLATIGFTVVQSKLRHGAMNLKRALGGSALATSLAVAALIAATASATPYHAIAIYTAWLGVVWILLALLHDSTELFTLSQIAIVLAIFAGVAAATAPRAWYVASARPWLDPWFLEAQGIALAGYAMLLCFARWAVGRRAEATIAEGETNESPPSWLIRAQRLLNPPWPAVDRVVEIAVVALVLLIAVYAVAPGIAQELAPLSAARGNAAAVREVAPIENFEVAGIPHAHAGDRGAWFLLGAVATLVVAGLLERAFRRAETRDIESRTSASSVEPRDSPTWGRLSETAVVDSLNDSSKWRPLAVLLLAAMVCPLLAARWETDVAAASALRWLSAGFFLVASLPFWLRGRSASTRSMPSETDWRDCLRVQARDLLVALTVVVYVAMGAYVAQAALRFDGVDADAERLLPFGFVWALVAAIVAILVPRLAASGDAQERAAGTNGARLTLHARDVLLFLAIAPLAILLTFTIARVLDQHPVTGPNLDSWFRRIGWDVSYGVPLAAIAIGFVVYAIRERSSRFAFSAGLLLNVVATIVVLMRLARGGGVLDATAWMIVTQVNATVAAAAALIWLAAVSWHRRYVSVPLASPVSSATTAAQESRSAWTALANFGELGSTELAEVSRVEPVAHGGAIVHPALLVTQVALASALCVAFLAPAAARLAFEWSPLTMLPGWVAEAGSVWGWSALGLTTSAAIWLAWRRSVGQLSVAIFAAAIIAMLAVTSLRFGWDKLESYHVLLVGSCAAAWLLPLVTHAVHRIIGDRTSEAPALRWSTWPTCLFATVAVWLALWEYSSAVSIWAVAVLAAMSAWSVWVAWYDASGGFMWIAAVLAVIAGSITWIEWGNALTGTTGSGVAIEFLWINVIIIAVMAVLSVSIHRRRVLMRADSARPWQPLGFHRFAAWLLVATLLLTTGIGLMADWWNESIQVSFALAWAAWLAAAVAAIACWWDPATRWPAACLYCVGLLAVGLFLDGLDFRPPMFDWALANSLAAYSLATSVLWSRRAELRATFSRLGATSGALALREEAGHGWLVVANLFLGICVLLLVTTIELTMDNLTQRMVAAYSIGAQALAIGFLARGTARTSLQYVALVFGVLFAVAFGWAWVRPGMEAPWLHRAVVSAVALALMVVVYGFGLVKFLKRDNEWTRAAARLVPPLAMGAVALLLVVLGMEVAIFRRLGAVPIAMPALVAVGVALVGLAAAGLTAALLPGRDPLSLSERGRTAYVYAAEGLAALLFLHIRVTMPYLFSGWFLQFWPLIVMGIAFVGVGLGELFQRRRQRVLSEPLQTTGALLPLLPALGFWVVDVDSRVDYSLLLLTVGVLYAALSVLRRSFLFGIMAAISANGSLWYLLFRREGLGLLEHPQLWLIPPALSALVASYLNRDRLTREQTTALRYVCAIVIYVSSTADIFINGVADAPWLPAVLAGISILGVFAGIVLRVRAFLYLGTSFLMIAIITIIWYAAVEQERTWILWVAGIVTGVLIIALFGLFEKRRDDVLRVVEELKQWQA